MTHTPTPWDTERQWRLSGADYFHPIFVTGKNQVVGEVKKEEDAAFIVKACNAHDRFEAFVNCVRLLVERKAEDTESIICNMALDLLNADNRDKAESLENTPKSVLRKLGL